MIHKAQEIVIHYNESKKNFSLNKKQSRKSVMKSSENNNPSYSKDTFDNKDKKSNDQCEFKITSISDNEIILKNKEKFLNVLQDITEQMNKRFSQMPSKRGIQSTNTCEEIIENMHYYSNIDHVNLKSDDRIFQNLSLREHVKIEKENIFSEKNYKSEDGVVSDLNQEPIKIIKEEVKDIQIKSEKSPHENQHKAKQNKKCSCYCLII